MAIDWYAQMIKEKAERRTKTNAAQAGIFALLKKHGVEKVHVNYDGSGDDGQVNDTEFFDKKGEDITDRIKGIMTTEEVTLGEYGAGIITEKARPGSLYEIVEEHGSQLLSDAPFDWVNNEGGYGFVEYVVSKKTIKFQHNERIESSEYNEYDA